MKHFILIGLFALALSLGVGCKKETVTVPANEISKTELHAPDANLKPSTLGTENPGNPGGTPGIGGYPGGENTYPHSTGACYCGVYSVCHPYVHKSWCTYVNPGQMQNLVCNCNY